jgi:hypothetical protein
MQDRIMKLHTVILSALLAFPGFTYAADKIDAADKTVSYEANKSIYKCADAGGVAYRDTPCATPQQQTVVVAARKVNWQPENAKQSYSAEARLSTEARSSTTSPVYATRLFMGMTDTQVLNLPGWGRPARIIRSKEGRQWREQWIYKDRSTGEERRALFFENARLVDQEDASIGAMAQVRAMVE